MKDQGGLEATAEQVLHEGTTRELLAERAIPRRSQSQVWREMDVVAKKLAREGDLGRKLELLSKQIDLLALLQLSAGKSYERSR